MKKPDNAKERNLIKGAVRRVFSRSDLRKQALDASRINYANPDRPRVTKWSECAECKTPTPTYKIEIDHVAPIIDTKETLEDLTWDTLVERVWCPLDNLRALCTDCHKKKTKAENAERRRYRKERK